MFSHQDEELLKLVDEAWDEAWEILIDEEGWKEEKKGDHGEVVKVKKNKKGKKKQLKCFMKQNKTFELFGSH